MNFLIYATFVLALALFSQWCNRTNRSARVEFLGGLVLLAFWGIGTYLVIP